MGFAKFPLNIEIRQNTGNCLPDGRKRGIILPIRHMVILLCSLALASPASGSELQSHESIRITADRYVRDIHAGYRGNLKLKVAHPDRRLRLRECDEDLETFSSTDIPGRSRYSVGIRCNSDQPWTLYVPVTVSILRKVLVVDRGVKRGGLLTKADMRLEERDVTRLRQDYLERPEQALGKTPKRSLKAGAVLTASLLESSSVVRRGNRVTILGEIGGISVRMQGKALDDGALGERIQVRNSSSNRRIEATVVAAGIVRVTL